MQRTLFKTQVTKKGHKKSYDTNTENDACEDVETFVLALIENYSIVWNSLRENTFCI